MRELVGDIAAGGFVDEWDAESRAGHPRLRERKERHAGPMMEAFERTVRRQLGMRDDG